MGFVDPQSVSNPTSGAAISAAWGDATRDAIMYVGANKPHCNAYETTPLNIANVTNVAMPMGFERYDIGGNHSTASNTSRFTLVDAGKYLLVGAVSWDNNGTNGRKAFWQANGATALPGSNFRAAYGTSDMETVTLYPFTAGTYVELVVFQDSGGTRTAVVDATVYWMGT